MLFSRWFISNTEVQFLLHWESRGSWGLQMAAVLGGGVGLYPRTASSRVVLTGKELILNFEACSFSYAMKFT